MSAQQYDRWYILPPVAAEAADREGLVPKYTDQDGIEGYAGTLVDAANIEGSYPGLVTQFDQYDEWWIVRLYGSWAALNQISIQQDSINLATNPQDVDAVLSQRFPDLDVSDWGSKFFASTD